MMRIIYILCLFVFCSCIKEYAEQDFYDSKWINSNGSTIELNSDYTCKVQNMRWNLYYEGFQDFVSKDQPSSFKGKWRIDKASYGRQRIYIFFNRTSINFDIESKNTIFASIGDPDLGVYYLFNRTE